MEIRFEAVDRASHYLQERGYFEPPKPEDIFFMPPDISNITDKELMNLWQLALEWRNYSAYELANAEILEIIQKKVKDMVFEKILLNNQTAQSYKSVEERKAFAKNLSEVQQEDKKYFYCLAKIKYLKAIYQQFEDFSNLFSRELTRRTSSLESRLIRTG